MNKNEVKEGDFFVLSEKKGYSRNMRNAAMQVMECYNLHMTVKCKNGCMTKPYDHFQKIDDTLSCAYVYYAPYFEDNRTTLSQTK